MRAQMVSLVALLAAGCDPGEIDDSGDLVDEEYDLAGCPVLDLEVVYELAAVLAGGRFEIQEARAAAVETIGTTNKLVRSIVQFGDNAFGGPRAETAVVGNGASRYAAGQARFYGFRVLIPAGWVNDGINEDIVFQWHNIPDTGEASKSPNLFLAVKRNELVLRITSDAQRISTATSPVKSQILLVGNLDLAHSIWHDFVFEVTWSYQAGAGRVRVWHKTSTQASYALVANRAGPNMHNDVQKGYVKWGIYKPSWRNGVTAVNRREVRHDNIRVGRSFTAVRPDLAACR